MPSKALFCPSLHVPIHELALRVRRRPAQINDFRWSSGKNHRNLSSYSMSSLWTKARAKLVSVSVLKHILRYSVNTWDQGFMHKLSSSTNPTGVISEYILSVLDVNVSGLPYLKLNESH